MPTCCNDWVKHHISCYGTQEFIWNVLLQLLFLDIFYCSQDFIAVTSWTWKECNQRTQQLYPLNYITALYTSLMCLVLVEEHVPHFFKAGITNSGPGSQKKAILIYSAAFTQRNAHIVEEIFLVARLGLPQWHKTSQHKTACSAKWIRYW